MAPWKSGGFLLDLETSAGADPDLASPGAEAIALEVPLAPLHGAAVVGPKTEFESMKKSPFLTVDQVTRKMDGNWKQVFCSNIFWNSWEKIHETTRLPEPMKNHGPIFFQGGCLVG